MRVQNEVYNMTDRELRAYKRMLRRRRERIRKCLAGIMTVCLILVCAVSYHAIRSNASSGNDEINFKYYTEITVQHGDTIWDIADEYIDYDEYKNKSAYVAEVTNINHLDAEGTIKAGQCLIVPYYSHEFVK